MKGSARKLNVQKKTTVVPRRIEERRKRVESNFLLMLSMGNKNWLLNKKVLDGRIWKELSLDPLTSSHEQFLLMFLSPDYWSDEKET